MMSSQETVKNGRMKKMVDADMGYLNEGFTPIEPGRLTLPEDCRAYKMAPQDGDSKKPSFTGARTPGLRARTRGTKDPPALPYQV